MTDSSKIQATRSRNSEIPLNGFTQEEQHKTILFFGRLPGIYGRSKLNTLFNTPEQLKMTRREWAQEIGQYSVDQLERALNRAKQRRMANDPDFQWPDIAKILSLITRDREHACHRPAPIALPEPKEHRDRRRAVGRENMRNLMKSLRGGAS